MRSLRLFHPRVKFLVAAFSLMSAWPADADTSRNEEIAERFAAAMPIASRRPDLTNGMITARSAVTKLIWPPIRSVSAGGWPL